MAPFMSGPHILQPDEFFFSELYLNIVYGFSWKRLTKTISQIFIKVIITDMLRNALSHTSVLLNMGPAHRGLEN